MKTKSIIIILVTLLAAKFAFTQNEIKGKIIDSQTKEPLSNVNVTVKGTNSRTISDINGFFSLQTSKSTDSVTVSYIGYETETVKYYNNIIIAMVPSEIQLNQVIVSANRYTEKRNNVPVAVSTLSPQQINEAKAVRLDELLNKINGVYMIDLGNEQHAMGGLRQPFNNYSNPVFLYLEDGIPIRPAGVFNHNALIEINMADIKSIEVIGGPSSAIYGSDAVGGAINFITKQPPLIPTATISLQGNNLGYKRVDFNAGNTINKLGVNLSGYYANRRNGYREHSDFDKLALSLKANYRLTDKTTLKNSVAYINYKTDMTGGLDSANFFGGDYSSLQTFTYRTVDALRVSSALKHIWNNNGNTSVTAYYRLNAVDQNPHYTQKLIDENDPSKEQSEIDNNEFYSIGSIIRHTQKLKFLNTKLTIGASTDYTLNDRYKQYILVNVNEDGVKTGYTETDSIIRDYDVTLINSAIYTHLNISPIKRLNLSATVRYDMFSYDYRQTVEIPKFEGKVLFNKLIPKVGIVYNFEKNRGVYANYSVGFLPPNPDQLYRRAEANNELEPAVYYNTEAGGWFSVSNKFKIQLAAYIMNGVNEVVTIQNDFGENEYENAGKTQHKGIEYTIQYAPASNIILRLSAANTEHKYIEYTEKGEDYSGEIMEMSPTMIANAEITYKPEFLKGNRIGIEWQHLGEYYAEPPKLTGDRATSPGFDIFNIRFGYRIKSFETWLNIMNFTDELYATSAGVRYGAMDYRPGDPIKFNIGLAYNFTGNKTQKTK